LKRTISRDQAKDTGMAMVLIFLILGFFLNNSLFFKIATLILLVNMISPIVYKPIAIAWLGLSYFIGSIVSKVLLTIIFFVVVTPIGLIRHYLGNDPLKLKRFKKDNESVMQVRNITFDKTEIEKPY
jgi:hypothetical protein